MKKVWILFYLNNDYNQPEKAFKKLYWDKPTAEQLGKDLNFLPEFMIDLANGKVFEDIETIYWIEEFSN